MEILMSPKDAALRHFATMLDPTLHHKTVEVLVENVRDLVFSGQTTYEELGFTDMDCVERLRQAKVRNGVST